MINGQVVGSGIFQLKKPFAVAPTAATCNERSRFRRSAAFCFECDAYHSLKSPACVFEGEIVRRARRQCKRGMLRSAAQDDTGEQMNLPCRREAEPHAPRSATKFGFQILALA